MLVLLQRWRQRFGDRRRRCPTRPLAAMGYLAHGPVIDDLIEVENLALVVLHDKRDARGRPVLRLAGFSGGRVPWGVRWGGCEHSLFYKNLLLPPVPGGRGPRLIRPATNFCDSACNLTAT